MSITVQVHYRIFSFVKVYMESADQKVWVKHEAGHAVKVSVPSSCDVSDLIKVIKGELSPDLDAFSVGRIELTKPEEERKEGEEYKDEEDTAYEPDVLVSVILQG